MTLKLMQYWASVVVQTSYMLDSKGRPVTPLNVPSRSSTLMKTDLHDQDLQTMLVTHSSQAGKRLSHPIKNQIQEYAKQY